MTTLMLESSLCIKMHCFLSVCQQLSNYAFRKTFRNSHLSYNDHPHHSSVTYPDLRCLWFMNMFHFDIYKYMLQHCEHMLVSDKG